MLFWRLKQFFALAAATLFCALALFGVRTVNAFKFSQIAGEHTYYLDTASSQALQTQTLSFFQLSRVKGESVRFFVDNADGLAEEIAIKYGAEIVHVEEASGVVSYYGYTPAWGDSVCVAGKAVNLHIAMRGRACAVGSPIIFGGF